ncbi:MAG: MFS transporter [Planctomycetota bacterium]
MLQRKVAGAKLALFFGYRLLERWRRNFIAVWPGLFATSLGLTAVIPTLPLYIEERFGITDPAAIQRWTAIVFGAGPIAASVCGPFWGALGDRLSRKAMVVRAQLGVAVSLALMPLAEDPTMMTVLRLMQGVFAGHIAPSMALVIGDAPPDRHGRVIGQLALALALGTALGPMLGAEITGRFDRRQVFWVGGAAAAAAALIVSFVAVRGQEPRPRDAAGKAAAGPGVRDVLASRPLLAMVCLICAMRLGQHMVELFTALWVRELGAWPLLAPGDPELALERSVALPFTLLAVAQIATTAAWGRLADRFGPLRCLAVSVLSLAVLLLSMSCVTGILMYLVLRAIAAPFMAGFTTLSYAAVTRRAPASHKALAFALVQSGIHVGIAMGPMTGSVVAGSFGLRGAFVVASMVLFATGIAMLMLRRLERK